MASSSAPAGSSSGNNAPDGSGEGNGDNNGSASANVPDNGPEPPHYDYDSSFQIKAPTFDNTVKGFPTFKNKCNLYFAKMSLKRQTQYTGLQLLSSLTGTAWKLCEDLATDASYLKDPEKLYLEIVARLEHRFGESDVTKLPESI